MEHKDFNVIANNRGYQIQYKGHNIGGVGISSEAKAPRGRAALKQVDDYLREGEADIQMILNGNGQARFYQAIAQINKEQ